MEVVNMQHTNPPTVTEFWVLKNLTGLWWPANAIAILHFFFDTFHCIFLYFFFLICFLLNTFIFFFLFPFF